MKRIAALFTLLALAVAAVFGCDSSAVPSAGGSGGRPAADGNRDGASRDADWKPYDESGPAELSVLYVNEKAFYNDYGNLFLTRFPDVTFRVIPLSETRGEGDTIQDYVRAVEKLKPDIVVMNESQYEAMARNGGLYDLDVPVRRSGFDLDGFVPGLIERLTAKGGGRLYGLANTFDAKVLYYNKTLFDAYRIPYPEDGMSWTDLLRLAERFPAADADGRTLYGLFQPTFTSDPFELVYRIGLAEGLALFGPESASFTLDSTAWRDVFVRVARAYASGKLYYPEDPIKRHADGTSTISLGKNNVFLDGRAAMAIDNLLTMQMHDLMERMKTNGPGPIQWDTVTLPVDPSRPQTTTDFATDAIFGIHARSANAPLAWELIRYIHSDEYMKLISRSTTKLLARTGYAADYKGRDLSDFYALKPDASYAVPLVPKGFTKSFRELAKSELAAVANGSRSAEESFATLVRLGTESFERSMRESGGVKEEFGAEELAAAP
ncbi:ABC transporter substrate-binding protein [Paenibacillus flagellatus]|uniref:ABC transporter substrate-binding protein n=1 Tax=Paenibacillus flagellatus TaxID=2211139 RepID=A0A2V5K8D0_9BACL|nr:extracellular solute-binding protein [Paenibacillus flagellatus]PYI55759.1 hypothetical protein DLM86_08550 [Paenibacillus flagellatus]